MGGDINIKQIESKDTDEWLLSKHYAKRKCQRQYCFGVFVEKVLEGVVTYGQPPSPQVGRGFLGEENRTKVIELNRLVINSNVPKNTASRLVSKSMRLLPKMAIVSYADSMMGHIGYIYQACNFIYCGATKSHDNEYLIDGKWVHPKVLTNRGITAPSKWAKENNIQKRKPMDKHRYIFFTDKKLRQYLLYKSLPYPKGESMKYDCVDITIKQPNLF
jgi:hypothetical protein